MSTYAALASHLKKIATDVYAETEQGTVRLKTNNGLGDPFNLEDLASLPPFTGLDDKKRTRVVAAHKSCLEKHRISGIFRQAGEESPAGTTTLRVMAGAQAGPDLPLRLVFSLYGDPYGPKARVICPLVLQSRPQSGNTSENVSCDVLPLLHVIDDKEWHEKYHAQMHALASELLRDTVFKLGDSKPEDWALMPGGTPVIINTGVITYDDAKIKDLIEVGKLQEIGRSFGIIKDRIKAMGLESSLNWFAPGLQGGFHQDVVFGGKNLLQLLPR